MPAVRCLTRLPGMPPLVFPPFPWPRWPLLAPLLLLPGGVSLRLPRPSPAAAAGLAGGFLAEGDPHKSAVGFGRSIASIAPWAGSSAAFVSRLGRPRRLRAPCCRAPPPPPPELAGCPACKLRAAELFHSCAGVGRRKKDITSIPGSSLRRRVAHRDHLGAPVCG